MSREFKLEKRYYGESYDLYKKKTITINEGLTVLVGCNGSGKSTMLHQIEEQLKKENIPVMSFDNLKDGGSRAISSAGFFNDFDFMATALASSEGENIILNIGKLASCLRAFIKKGEITGRKDSFMNGILNAIREENDKEIKEIPNERWLLLDAVDSGLSVDNIVEIKEGLFKAILEDAGDCKVYILISANEYELARKESCFDVYNGKYLNFSDYEQYRDFILKSKKIKNERYNNS